MTKHTPGPWQYIGDSLTHRQFDIYAPMQSPSQHICTVNNLSVEKLSKRNPEIAIANARLIAAAPELLSALKTICDRINPNKQCTYDHIRRDWEYAIKIIERATSHNQ